jgi:hypothetical protein
MEQLSPLYGAERRRLRVHQLREVNFRGGYHDFVIRRGGVDVFPRLIAADHHEVKRGEAVPRGGRDYLTTPLRRDALDRVLARFGAMRAPGKPSGATPIVGESAEIKRLLHLLSRVGPTDATVLIDGVHENVTGYDLTPRGIIKQLDLLRPQYEKTARYGHFGHGFTWEK